jgi:hypothetical protein
MFAILALVGLAFLVATKIVLPRFQSSTPVVSQSALDPIEAWQEPSFDQQLVSATLADQELQLIVVNQPASITQGLSGRETIGADGMLFVLGADRSALFWMKDMRFALDLIWIKDGRVVAVSEKVPPPVPGTPDEQLELYSSGQLVDMVLEVPAGQTVARGIQLGDALEFKLQSTQ